ncbi:hypothetical protein AB3S75_004068 [Citrus x aurantiifolia]
MSPYNW